MLPTSRQLPATSHPNLFCDTKYKTATIYTLYFSHKLYSIVMLVASVVTRIFNKELSRIYLSIAKAESIRAHNLFCLYQRFGNSIIEFSHNFFSRIVSFDKGKEALDRHYGSDTIDKWLDIGTPETPIDRKKLRFPLDGVCYGMTLDFAKLFLLNAQTGLSETDRIRQISPIYKKGPSKEAELIQIFNTALDTSLLRAKQYDIKQELSKKIEMLASILMKINDFIGEKTTEKVKEVFKGKLEEIMTTYIRHLHFKHLENFAESTEKPLMDWLGLQINLKKILSFEKTSDAISQDLQNLINASSKGCYFIQLINKNLVGHAILLIALKNNQYLVFDPSFGTFVFKEEEIVEKLLFFIYEYPCKKYLRMLFFSCNLKEI